MNYNPLPVWVDVVKAFDLHGQRYSPGQRVELAWRNAKELERDGMVQRVIEEDLTPGPFPKREGGLRDVLIFTPVYRLEPETVQALMRLEFEGATTLMLQRDNPHLTPRPDLTPRPPSLEGKGERDRERAGKANHLHQYRRGRETFLAGKWDAMLVVESDIIPPADALRRLAALKVDVAYGVYRFRVSDVVNIFERYPDNNGQRPRNVGESLSCKPWLLKRAVSMGRFPCSGAGLGIVLIRRRVLEAIDFRMEHPEGAHCDTFFSRDVLTHGFSQMAEMRVICGHKDEKGEVLWPRMPAIS